MWYSVKIFIIFFDPVESLSEQIFLRIAIQNFIAYIRFRIFYLYHTDQLSSSRLIRLTGFNKKKSSIIL